MTNSLLRKTDVDFLLILAENERYLSYKKIVDIYLEKQPNGREIINDPVTRRKVYQRFRQTKKRLIEIPLTLNQNYLDCEYLHQTARQVAKS